MNVTPHVAQNESQRRSAIDGRTTRHEGYGVSQRKRKRVEEVFGWMKTVALQRKTRFRGQSGWVGCLLSAAAAYNLVRMRNLQTASRVSGEVCLNAENRAFRPGIPPQAFFPAS